MNRKRSTREISAAAKRLGYSFDGQTKRGHLKWRSPTGTIVITGSRLTEACGFANAIKTLRHRQHEPDRRKGQP